jgi:transposase InsO family protein
MRGSLTLAVTTIYVAAASASDIPTVCCGPMGGGASPAPARPAPRSPVRRRHGHRTWCGGHFTADRPGQLHVADSTYVPLDGGGFGYTALVIDAFAGLVAGWECSPSKQTAFVERVIRPAAGSLWRGRVR